MTFHFALQVGWRLILAVSLAVMPWTMQAQAAPTQHVSAMTKPCGHAADPMTAMTKHAGCPDRGCPKSVCDFGACVTHCTMAAIFPMQLLDRLVGRQQNLDRKTSLVLDDPLQESLRPPIG